MRDPNRRGRVAAWTLVLSLAVGCVPKVDGIGLRDVDVSLPEAFGDSASEGGDLDALRRSEVFDDPALTALIDEALTHNQELEIVRQEIHADFAEILARRGETLPRLDLGVGVGVEKVGRFTSQGASDAADEMEAGREIPEHLGEFRLAFRASWEIDLWKRLRNATAAARARYLASLEGRNFLVTGIVAEVADAYYELVALDRQLAVVDANVALLREALDVVRLQQQAARVTALGVQRFEAELLRTEARRYEIAQRQVETENRLNALCGRYPQRISRTATGFLDASLAPMDAGIPSELLVQRPDIRQAERALQASQFDVKSARAAFFPSLSIDATFGIEAFNPAKLIALPASLLYGVAADLFAPLLNRAGIKADYFAANARQMQAVVGYEQTVLLAFVDVANQISAITNADRRFDITSRQVERLEEAVETSNLLFLSARADYLEVLTTRREALEAELERVETRQAQVRARIDLYRALGGGWPGAILSPEHTVAWKQARGATP